MNVSRLRLITFDVTDTLLKFRSPPGKQYSDVGAIYGVFCDSKSLTANFKAHWIKMNAEHPNFGRDTGLGWEMWWREIVTATFKDTKIKKHTAESIASHLIQIYETSMCWQQSHGALGLLSYLRNCQIPLGIISNYDPRLERTLVNTRLRHYFDFVVASYIAGVAKPHTDIFKEAMEVSKIKDLKPEQCLHIGNTAILDYVGAKNSGWHAILIHDEQETDQIRKLYPSVHHSHMFHSLFHFHRYFMEHNSCKKLNDKIEPKPDIL